MEIPVPKYSVDEWVGTSQGNSPETQWTCVSRINRVRIISTCNDKNFVVQYDLCNNENWRDEKDILGQWAMKN